MIFTTVRRRRDVTEGNWSMLKLQPKLKLDLFIIKKFKTTYVQKVSKNSYSKHFFAVTHLQSLVFVWAVSWYKTVYIEFKLQKCYSIFVWCYIIWMPTKFCYDSCTNPSRYITLSESVTLFSIEHVEIFIFVRFGCICSPNPSLTAL